jgi:hypothetical protein
MKQHSQSAHTILGISTTQTRRPCFYEIQSDQTHATSTTSALLVSEDAHRYRSLHDRVVIETIKAILDKRIGSEVTDDNERNSPVHRSEEPHHRRAASSSPSSPSSSSRSDDLNAFSSSAGSSSSSGVANSSSVTRSALSKSSLTDNYASSSRDKSRKTKDCCAANNSQEENDNEHDRVVLYFDNFDRFLLHDQLTFFPCLYD